MNTQRRRIRDKVIEQIDIIIETLTDLSDAEEEAYENMPENLQVGERGQQNSENVSALYSIIYEFETLKDELESVD